MPSDSMEALTQDILRFRDERDWKQFHTPRQLAAAIAIESGELQETLLWKSDAEVTSALTDPHFRNRVAEELADVVILSLLMADAIAIRLDDAVRSKLRRNAENYPIAKARGNAKKHTEL